MVCGEADASLHETISRVTYTYSLVKISSNLFLQGQGFQFPCHFLSAIGMVIRNVIGERCLENIAINPYSN